MLTTRCTLIKNKAYSIVNIAGLTIGIALLKEGVMFSTDKILPHVMQAAEPEKDWIVPYSKIKIYEAHSAIVLKGLN